MLRLTRAMVWQTDEPEDDFLFFKGELLNIFFFLIGELATNFYFFDRGFMSKCLHDIQKWGFALWKE